MPDDWTNPSLDRTGITWLIPDLLGGAAMPGRAELAAWKQTGVSCIVNLIGEPYGRDALDLEQEMGFELYHLPIRDMEAPLGVDEMDRALVWITEQIEKRKKIVVHCLGGIGRTSTLLICFLVRQGYGLKTAFLRLQVLGLRPLAFPQLVFIQRYYRHTRRS